VSNVIRELILVRSSGMSLNAGASPKHVNATVTPATQRDRGRSRSRSGRLARVDEEEERPPPTASVATACATAQVIGVYATLISGAALPEVRVETHQCVRDVKQLLAAVTSTPVQHLKLMFDGRELLDDRTMSEEALPSETHVQLIRLPPPDMRDVPSLLSIVEDEPLLISLLLDCSADPDEVDELGWTALHWAVHRGLGAVAEALAQHPRFTLVDAADVGRMTALHLCAQKGLALACGRIASRLSLRALNARANNGNTALHLAARSGHAESCLALLAVPGFRAVNDQNTHGWTALHYAAAGGLDKVCKKLLFMPGFSASDERTLNGETALHWAALNGHVDICRLLLHSCDVVAQDVEGLTALDGAERSGRAIGESSGNHAAVCELLRQACARRPLGG